MNGQPIQVVRSWFNILTFKKNGTLLPPQSDRHVRARAELALALEQPIRDTAVADASTRFLARGGQWKPSAAPVRRIEQTACTRGIHVFWRRVTEKPRLTIYPTPAHALARTRWDRHAIWVSAVHGGLLHFGSCRLRRWRQ
jgi:hypothetical protein